MSEAAPQGFVRDVRALIARFTQDHPGAEFAPFRQLWRVVWARRRVRALTRQRRQGTGFSLVHDARPASLTEAEYTQALFSAALSLLPRAPAETVTAAASSVLYALLLLHHTQHRRPRVLIYVPIGARGAPNLRLPRG